MVMQQIFVIGVIMCRFLFFVTAASAMRVGMSVMIVDVFVGMIMAAPAMTVFVRMIMRMFVMMVVRMIMRMIVSTPAMIFFVRMIVMLVAMIVRMIVAAAASFFFVFHDRLLSDKKREMFLNCRYCTIVSHQLIICISFAIYNKGMRVGFHRILTESMVK